MENNISFVQLIKKAEELARILQEKDHKIKILEAEKVELKEEIKRSYAENVELQKKYEDLLVARSLVSINKNDIAAAKAKLTTMMNTIDRCVEKINDDSHGEG